MVTVYLNKQMLHQMTVTPAAIKALLNTSTPRVVNPFLF